MTGPYWYINLAEAAFWGVLALVVLAVAAARRRLTWRTAMPAATLAALGLSDVVETRTGAWWDPWWLLLWKAACVALLARCALAAIGARRRRGAAGAPG